MASRARLVAAPHVSVHGLNIRKGDMLLAPRRTGGGMEGRLLSDDEFDHLRVERRRHSNWWKLECPECGSELRIRGGESGVGEHGERRFIRTFFHYPANQERACSNTADETAQHLDAKERIAQRAVEAGFRAELEEWHGGRKPDVSIYRADQSASHGPLMLAEVQRNLTDVAELDARTSDLMALLYEFPTEREYRRTPAWYVPARTKGANQLVDERAMMFLAADTDEVVDGIYTRGERFGEQYWDVEGPPVRMTLVQELTARSVGNVRAISLNHRQFYDNGQPVFTHWVTPLNDLPRGARRRRRKSVQGGLSHPCPRGLEGFVVSCRYCSRPVIWAALAPNRCVKLEVNPTDGPYRRERSKGVWAAGSRGAFPVFSVGGAHGHHEHHCRAW